MPPHLQLSSTNTCPAVCLGRYLLKPRTYRVGFCASSDEIVASFFLSVVVIRYCANEQSPKKIRLHQCVTPSTKRCKPN